MNGPSDPRPKLADISDQLLAGLRRIRGLEERKRSAEISTPEFHSLAEEVESESRRVFRLADEEEEVGDRTERRGDTIDDIARGAG